MHQCASMVLTLTDSVSMKYLGILISDKVLGIGAFQGICSKMTKRLVPWKAKFMTSGGKLILTNTEYLFEQPSNVCNGVSCFTKGGSYKMDTIWSRFFLRGADDNFKHHMAKWISICQPKIHGGLGIISTEIMNQCLLTKWIWKIEKGSNDLWF